MKKKKQNRNSGKFRRKPRQDANKSWKKKSINLKKKRKSGQRKMKIEDMILLSQQWQKETLIQTVSFEELNINAKILQNLSEMGFEIPTPIQVKAYQPISEGNHFLGIAATGTGKTAAFLLPLIQRAYQHPDKIKVIIMAPTRELVLQITQEFKALASGLELNMESFIGGTSIRRDVRKLENPMSFIAATPGRLKDLVKRSLIKLSDFTILVLDEYDKMLEMGFSKEVNYIIREMPALRQALFFSATYDNSLRKKIDRIARDLVIRKASEGQSLPENIDQQIIKVKKNRKFDKLLDMLVDQSLSKVLIFRDTRLNVMELVKELKSFGVAADEIHGDKTQAYRLRALQRFKSGAIRVLVATDVASRGLDIAEVSHVINYDPPDDFQTYIHRIGRTARAGSEGIAITFVEAK